jgi:hypothetical protein
VALSVPIAEASPVVADGGFSPSSSMIVALPVGQRIVAPAAPASLTKNQRVRSLLGSVEFSGVVFGIDWTVIRPLAFPAGMLSVPEEET